MKRAALLILDGWGYREDAENNAIRMAHTPNLNALAMKYPMTTINASGMAVGLPEGQMGNSEVGHLNIGAGRIVYQDFTRINLAVENGEFFSNPELNAACDAAVSSGGALQLMGLVSDGGVHSHINHLKALVKLAKRRGLTKIFVHALLDGRDTPPRSGQGYIEELDAFLAETGVGRIATVQGRFYGMDRDTRWERVEKGYAAIRRSEGLKARTAAEAVALAYQRGETDEFVLPTVITGDSGEPAGPLADGDAFIFFNFRSDRARQMTRALTQEGFKGFDVSDRPRFARYVMFTVYDETFGLPVAFPPHEPKRILAEVLEEAGLRQLRIAETEKYAHVTFFFNGGVEKSHRGEDRVLIESPREVATYDQKPEMSARLVRDRLVQEIDREIYDCIICNFANLDMVGHTGILGAAIKAVEAVDECVGRVVGELLQRGYSVILTADHGNAEEMWDRASGQPMTAHTTNPVPLIVADDRFIGAKLREGGILADVAPTLLRLMGIPQPSEMTGKSLVFGEQ